MIQRHVWVNGRVQGVGFRASTVQEAIRYPSLKGFVRNLPDGRVEAVIVGEDREVLALVAWLKHGPPSSRVEGIVVQEESPDAALGAFEFRK